MRGHYASFAHVHQFKQLAEDEYIAIVALVIAPREDVNPFSLAP
jgi:hypothetical protein